ncbi:malto-oligosyltrehalose synthase [Dyella sp. 2HG41-7]|uniref:malto-oligosyltrehalose synthase n=1 Tax=Dyella sp. 2HG41-7 TaxID=2883239 RepID=UPI001F1B902B|nr:malto-oligosyltrehalose synthase [Dyella sp. 2HG41-7]
MTALRATVRLQLNRDFDFSAAAERVPYFAALGLSHVYLSPIAMARPGSTHGYDVINPAIVNPELGGESGLVEFVRVLHQHNMGAIIDIVPNHMAADVANPWWADVLALGRASRYAHYFDIDWSAPDTEGKLWLPILAAPLEQALAHDELTLERHIGGTTLALSVAGTKFPVSEQSLRFLFDMAGFELPRFKTSTQAIDAVRRVTQDNARCAAIDQAIERLYADEGQMRHFLDLQHYRLAWWRSGNQVINYRRFFDIDSLAALAMDREEVFEAVHALPLRLIKDGLIDGLRVDHVDGLTQPREYLRKLRHRVNRVLHPDPCRSSRQVTLHIEKILADDEKLRADWPVEGTTGYDFMNQVGALQHDPGGEAPLAHAWSTVTGRYVHFEDEAREARRTILATSLAADLGRCTRAFQRYATDTPEGGDLTPLALQRTLAEVLEHMSVYRTYSSAGLIKSDDRRILEQAFEGAAKDGDPDLAEQRTYLHQYLLETKPRWLDSLSQRRHLQTARRLFEQLSTSLNAKAIEDTAFYRYGVLLSRNEVGSDPRVFSLDAKRFHEQMQKRAAICPRSLLATATHDHKRGEDTRARMAIISERAQWFVDNAKQWLADLHNSNRPSRGTQWILLQTILAAWPLGMAHDDKEALSTFAARIQQWLIKAEREAKLHTRWTTPNRIYEEACKTVVHDILVSPHYEALREYICRAAQSLDAPGALNGLVATTLRLTVPGVPDLYQGADYWDQSLVDPDNRRPVDYALRQTTIQSDEPATDLLANYRNGVLKQHIIRRLLNVRKRHPELFIDAAYEPLDVIGPRKDHLVVFLRRRGKQQMLVAVPRLCAQELDGDRPIVRKDFWGSTAIAYSDRDGACTLVDLFTRVTHRSGAGSLPVQALLSHWPVAVLVSEPDL